MTISQNATDPIRWVCLSAVLVFMGLNSYAIWPRMLFQKGMVRLQMKSHREAAGLGVAYTPVQGL